MDSDGIEWKAVTKPLYEKISSDILMEDALVNSSNGGVVYAYYGIEYKFDAGVMWNDYHQKWVGFISLGSDLSPNGSSTFYTSNQSYPGASVSNNGYIPAGDSAYVVLGVENNKLNYTLYNRGNKSNPKWEKIWDISIPIRYTPVNAKWTQMATIAYRDPSVGTGSFNKGIVFDRVNAYDGSIQVPWTKNILHGVALGKVQNSTVTYQDLSSSKNLSKVKINLEIR